MKALTLPLVLIAGLAAMIFAQEDRKQTTRKPKARVAEKGVRFDPVIKNIEGWTVHVDPALLEGEHAETGSKALRMLADHLNRVSLLVQGEPLAKLKKCEIWIEHQHPSLGAMQYHPGERWLRDHGHDPRLVKKVHIPRAAALISRGQLIKHPAVVLHELSHAYHDQMLGFEYKPVVDSYRKAMKDRSYEKVLLYTGRTVKHYGATNHKEYFAEGTEAYFYHNDFYPFVRAELKLHDPTLHDALEKIWGPVR
jgi:dipeptidyl-peptidase-4